MDKEAIVVRCIYLNYNKDFNFHLNKFRYLNPHGEDRRRMESVTIHSFHKNLEIPVKSEGFEYFDMIDSFCPGPFPNGESEERLFFMHLSEK